MTHTSKRDPICSYVDNTGVSRPVLYRQFNQYIKDKVELAGLEPRHYSTHSLRRGGATWALECNVEESLIQILGTWQSDCYKMYIDWSLKKRVSAAKRMTKGIKIKK